MAPQHPVIVKEWFARLLTADDGAYLYADQTGHCHLAYDYPGDYPIMCTISDPILLLSEAEIDRDAWVEWLEKRGAKLI